MVRIWNSDSMQCVEVISTGCTVAAVKLRCTHLAVGSFNASATLWTLLSGEVLGRYVGHTSAVFSVDFSHVLDVFVTGSADRTVILWSLTNKIPFNSIQTTFKPCYLSFIFPSEIHHRCSSFILVASDFREYKTRLVNFRNRNNIVISDVKLPLNRVDGTMDCHSHVVGADVDVNNKLILACQTSTGLVEHCITFLCGEHTSKSSIRSSSSELVEEPQTMLDICHRDIPSPDAKQLLLLGAASCFSMYMCRQAGNNELLIVHHNLYSQSESVGLCHLPNNCR